MLALLALALVGGGAWLALHAKPTTTAQNPTPQPPPPVPAPSLPVPAPVPKPTIEVILDSNPTGAKILRDGVVTAETPEALKLTGPATVVLHKDGWTDKTVTVNPATTHKMVVKLERARVAAVTPPKKTGKDEHATPAKAPAKPSDTMDPYAGKPVEKTPAKPVEKAAPAKPVEKTAPAKPVEKSHDELSSRVEKQAASSVPGGHRLGTIYRGAAAEEGGRSDWYVDSRRRPLLHLRRRRRRQRQEALPLLVGPGRPPPDVDARRHAAREDGLLHRLPRQISRPGEGRRR